MQCAFSHPNYLALVGLTGCALPKATSGAPIWPTGVVGSLSHDSRVAVAAVGRRRDFSALEINIEPASPLPSELLDLVATPQERAEIGEDPYHGRLLLAAKEAVYKALDPLDHTFPDHHDVRISLTNRRVIVRNGRSFELRFRIFKHLLVLAFLRACNDDTI
jgi:4'-phosphopantetheinyl transferase EntD